jgi:CMP-N,N'-diacetyllegionaminic acid synthase
VTALRVLGLIPARGGSKAIVRKNVRPLAGKSMVERAYECARDSGVLDRIILSTDDPEIAGIARSCGLEVPFMRPPALAGDATPMMDVVIHALETLGMEGYRPDAVMLLQPTSPLRKPAHLVEAVCLLNDHESVCSVVPLPKDLCPHYVMKIDVDGYLDYFLPDGACYTRRQDVPQAYRREGTAFLTRAEVLLEQRSFYGRRCLPMIVPKEDSLNVDSEEEWEEAERRLAARG